MTSFTAFIAMLLRVPHEAGYYCPPGSTNQIACPIGTYNPSFMATSLASCLPCSTATGYVHMGSISAACVVCVCVYVFRMCLHVFACACAFAFARVCVFVTSMRTYCGTFGIPQVLQPHGSPFGLFYPRSICQLLPHQWCV